MTQAVSNQPLGAAAHRGSPGVRAAHLAWTVLRAYWVSIQSRTSRSRYITLRGPILKLCGPEPWCLQYRSVAAGTLIISATSLSVSTLSMLLLTSDLRVAAVTPISTKGDSGWTLGAGRFRSPQGPAQTGAPTSGLTPRQWETAERPLTGGRSWRTRSAGTRFRRSKQLAFAAAPGRAETGQYGCATASSAPSVVDRR